jgi:glutathione S-transferase
MLEQSPAARVPVLKHGVVTIWESLAIMEYLCEVAGAGLPRDRTARAHARTVSAEMHAGFGALRAQWPFNARATGRRTPMSAELRADIARVEALWCDCRVRFGGSGGWLFGDYSLADAMFAPVVLRFRTYGATLSAVAQAYVATTLQHAPLRRWLADAAAEPWRIDYSEIGEAG